MSQNMASFNEPIAVLMEAIKDGRLRHDGNPLLRWCAGNAVLVYDHQSRAMYSKKASAEKIDPIVALTMALAMAMRAPQRTTGNLFLS